MIFKRQEEKDVEAGRQLFCSLPRFFRTTWGYCGAGSFPAAYDAGAQAGQKFQSDASVANMVGNLLGQIDKRQKVKLRSLWENFYLECTFETSRPVVRKG